MSVLTLTSPIAKPRMEAGTLLWQGTALVAAVVPLTILALLLEDRVLNGINLWIKPLKFQLSVAMHLATMAILLRFIAPVWRQGGLVRWTAWACVLSGVFEIAYITLQAGRGEHSHFNFSTPVTTALYSAMGIGAVTLIAGALVIGVLVWARPSTGTGAGLRWGAILGMGLGLLGTLIAGGAMSFGTGHWVGGVASDVNGLAVVGWAREGGDLRVPHFFATHLMQALPLVGWAADQVSRTPVRWVGLATVTGVGVTGWTFYQALSGQPLIGM